MTLWSADLAALILEPLDELSAAYHRPSGVTHLLASPAPEILAALADGPLDTDALLARLADAYDLPDADPAALAARLGELAEAGLVRPA